MIETAFQHSDPRVLKASQGRGGGIRGIPGDGGNCVKAAFCCAIYFFLIICTIKTSNSGALLSKGRQGYPLILEPLPCTLVLI